MSDSVTLWTAAHQTSLFFTISQSLLKLISMESVMPLNHLILSHPFLLLSSIFLSIRVLSSERLFTSGGQGIGASASASVLPMDIQDWFPLGWTGLSPSSPRDSQESSPALQFESINKVDNVYFILEYSVHENPLRRNFCWILM